MAVKQRARARGAAAAVLALLLGAVTATAQAPSSSTASFDESYRRAQQANAALKTLTADFTESTTSSLLARPLVAHGTLVVQRPSRVILRYSDPEARVVLIDGDRMTMTWPSRQVRQQTDITRAQSRVQRYFVQGSAEELRREFDIELRNTSERPGTQEVRLRPKRKQIRETLTTLDLWIDPATSLLSAMRMTFANGETKTMTLANVVTNPALGSDAFSVER
jgi:outer membrane lipoprotein-sorting protein